MAVSTSPFRATPIASGHVLEITRVSTGAFIGLIRRLADGWRAHGLDGWETHPTLNAAITAVARRSEVLGG